MKIRDLVVGEKYAINGWGDGIYITVTGIGEEKFLARESWNPTVEVSFNSVYAKRIEKYNEPKPVYLVTYTSKIDSALGLVKMDTHLVYEVQDNHKVLKKWDSLEKCKKEIGE